MMQKILVLLLACLLALPARAEDIPLLTITAANLSYTHTRPGEITIGSETLPVTIKYRGMYSATFAGKRNYSFHLKTASGAQQKQSLLGLRCDDDYALLGSLNDPSRLRNAVGMGLWRALGYPAPQCAPCEVVFSGYYKGLYFLFERPDRQSAGVPKTGALYRVLARSVAGVNALDGVYGDMSGDTWYNVEKVYPAGDAGWQPLQALLSDPESVIDAAAFCDYYLLMNLIGASDNFSKNLFLCWDGARFYPMPWDLDASFGRLYTAQPSEEGAIYTSSFFDSLLALPTVQALLPARREELLQKLPLNEIMGRFYALYEQLAAVWPREQARYPLYTDANSGLSYPLDPAGELVLIEQYLQKRYALLYSF